VGRLLAAVCRRGQALPPLVGIVIAGDADNTLGHSLGHLGSIRLE